MGAIKDLLDPETGERIGSQVAPPPCLQTADTKPQGVKTVEKREGFKTTSLLATFWRMYGALWPPTWEHFLAATILSTLLMSVNDPKLNNISQYLWMLSTFICLDERFPRFVVILSTSLITGTAYFITIALVRQILLKILH